MLEDLLKRETDLRGFCVTMPYKEKIMSLLDMTSTLAERCTNANCIKIERQGKDLRLKGFNTDAYGFGKSIESLGINRGSTACIMGSGGVSKTISVVLDDMGIRHLTVSRNPEGNQISYRQMNEILEDTVLIINATPLGMHPYENMMADIDTEKLTRGHCVFDLIYNPAETPLLKEAKARGARTMNGLDMLHLQADLAWKIFNSNL